MSTQQGKNKKKPEQQEGNTVAQKRTVEKNNPIEEKNVAKKFAGDDVKSVEIKQNKRPKICNNFDIEENPKMEFNPNIHLLPTGDGDANGEIMNLVRKDKRRKQTRKGIKKEKDYVTDYNNILLEKLEKKNYTAKSPHLLINRKWFRQIKENTIMLKNPREIGAGKERNVHYDVDEIGDNVNYVQKENKWFLNPSTTKYSSIYFMVRLSNMISLDKLEFHTEQGHMISDYDVRFQKNQCYILLAIIHIDKTNQKSHPLILNEDLDLMKRFYINQIAIKKGNYHFNTTGTIYGLGYGPKSNRNEFGHSVCKFANSKFLFFLIMFLF